MLKKTLNLILALVIIIQFGCDKKPKQKDTPESTPSPPTYQMKFDKDSAYHFIEEQVSFGPRVPGTPEHLQASLYLQDKLTQYCDTAFVQIADVRTWQGNYLTIRNIIGSFNPTVKKRILLCAHWDTRPQADEDPENPTEPALGANDGGSGVGVLLEIARQLQKQRPESGVDIVFFDAEDLGDRRGSPESWCLGSQYWAKNPHVQNYTARFGILLDMVGAKDAIFPIEGNSLRYAEPYVRKVWNKARALGHSKYFVNYLGGDLIDDHLFINRIIGIPTMNIVHYNPAQGGFGDFWHTHDDNMDVIDKNTLNAVGQTVFAVVKEF
jgi:hypothetical protein